MDKALLCGGNMLEPIEISLAGRAVSGVGGETVSIRDIAVESARGLLRSNMHAIDAERHVQIRERIRRNWRAMFQLCTALRIQMSRSMPRTGQTVSI